MSGQITRLVGEKLNLDAQLFDAARSMPQRVFTSLLRADGSVIKTIELTHVANGHFIDTAEVMPDEDTVIAQHVVYLSDGVTENEEYEVGHQRFEKQRTDFSDIGINRASVIEAEIEVVNELEAEVIDTDMIAVVEGGNADLEAAIYTDELEYFLDNNEIEGEAT